MILTTSIPIRTEPEAVFDFFANMETNYLRWHPDHVLFRWEGDGGLRVGNAFYFEERIGGKLLRKRVRFTRIEPGRLIEFALTNPLYRLMLPHISFSVAPEGDGVRVTRRFRSAPAQLAPGSIAASSTPCASTCARKARI